MTARTPFVPVAMLLAAVTLAGCVSLHDPDSPSPAATHTTATGATATATARAVTDADPVPERGGRIPAAVRATQTRLASGGAAVTPTAALERYATLWANWTAGTVVARQEQLARMSLGQARAQALQAAASFKDDSTLAASHVANTGRVIAIAPSLAVPGEWVIVTSETTTGRGDYVGLPATVHVTYAQLTHTPRGLVVSEWSPQT